MKKNQEGWIKIHRKITEWEGWGDIPTKVLFIQLLLEANHETNEWRGIRVLPGQLIFGRKEMSKKCGLSEQQVRTALKKLIDAKVATRESTKESTRESTKGYTLITLINWPKYQGDVLKSTKESTAKSPENQPHYKKYKKYKEEYISKDIYSEPIGSVEKNDGNEIVEKQEYGNKAINNMLVALKGRIGIGAFADSTSERMFGRHCVGLMDKLGKEEFVRRLDYIIADPFKRKNCNRIKFVYNEIKGFIEPRSNLLIL